MENDIFDRTFFTKERRDQTNQVITEFNDIQRNCVDILYRVTIASSPSSDMPHPPEVILDDVDTFVITTSAEQENIITYTSPVNIVDLNIRDCGYF